jgi:hypothetical protein
VRIVLKQQKRLYVIENQIPNAPTEDAKEEIRNEHQCYVNDDDQAICVMLANISTKLQRQHGNMDAHTMIMHLKKLLDEASRIERYETSKELFHYKMIEDSLVNTHVLKMIGYIKRLGQLNVFMDHELSIDLVLQSLPKAFRNLL